MDSATPDATVDEVLALLAEARQRTLLLAAPVPEEDLRMQHDPIMSPIVWDLGHVAHFEELWLAHNLDGTVLFSEMPGQYNPFEYPRHMRGALDYPALDDCLRTMAEIRSRVIARLRQLGPRDHNPLLENWHVVHMVLQHEYQHGETILQTLQLKRGAPYAAPRQYQIPSAQLCIPWGSMVRFPGGSVSIGTLDRTVAYDNERPIHMVDLAPFWIDVAPVRNGEFLEFMNDGGYRRRELWSEEGWAWVASAGVEAPAYWEYLDSRWQVRSMDRLEDVDPERPVCHVCYYEAEAFARWAGKRLPTEFEWEAAAAWDPSQRKSRRYPWGDTPPASPLLANLDQLTFGTAPVGAYPANVSPVACYGMIGDVWEWTGSFFNGYPGFQAFPYREYSEVFFGHEYRVLRGGSWATRPGAIRNTFRNWDYPMRRQIFAGFRCARDD
jgi:iron(II)-dependent oxidoreductase